jgi:hypothetical protein
MEHGRLGVQPLRDCGAIGEGNGFGAVQIMREVTSEESRYERGGGTGIDQGKGRDGRDGDWQQNALGSMRIFAKRNGFHIWTMRHKILSRKEFSELIIIMCVRVGILCERSGACVVSSIIRDHSCLGTLFMGGLFATRMYSCS